MLKEEARQILNDAGYTVEDATVYKNGIPFEGITVKKPDSNIAPTIYNEQLEKLEAETLLDLVKKHTENAPDISNIGDWETDKKRIKACLRKYIVDDVITAPFMDDLQIYARIYLSDNASIVIHEPLLKQYGITAEELLQTAKENTAADADYMSMGDIIGVPTPSMYVITNKARLHGASAITAGILAEVAADAGTDYLILIPSSIHEWIAYATNDTNEAEQIAPMITAVNASEVDPVEQLGTHPYIYTAATRAITAA